MRHRFLSLLLAAGLCAPMPVQAGPKAFCSQVLRRLVIELLGFMNPRPVNRVRPSVQYVYPYSFPTGVLNPDEFFAVGPYFASFPPGSREPGSLGQQAEWLARELLPMIDSEFQDSPLFGRTPRSRAELLAVYRSPNENGSDDFEGWETPVFAPYDASDLAAIYRDFQFGQGATSMLRGQDLSHTLVISELSPAHTIPVALELRILGVDVHFNFPKPVHPRFTELAELSADAYSRAKAAPLLPGAFAIQLDALRHENSSPDSPAYDIALDSLPDAIELRRRGVRRVVFLTEGAWGSLPFESSTWHEIEWNFYENALYRRLLEWRKAGLGLERFGIDEFWAFRQGLRTNYKVWFERSLKKMARKAHTYLSEGQIERLASEDPGKL